MEGGWGGGEGQGVYNIEILMEITSYVLSTI